VGYVRVAEQRKHFETNLWIKSKSLSFGWSIAVITAPALFDHLCRISSPDWWRDSEPWSA
jgi:hypothetical protein